ncbi:MAG: M48 family metalloprotease [Cyanobacteria bacterium P01_E01_bin.42]
MTLKSRKNLAVGAIVTEEQFNTLVKRLERNARQNPGLYKLQVGLLAMLGYIYILFALALLLAALVFLMAIVIYSNRISSGVIQLAVVLIGVIAIVARSLWVTMAPPNGIYLTRRRFPNLFGHLDKLTKKLKAPRCHHVILTGDFNAAVMQVSRLGIFGWQQNYLIIGLPLMQALSPSRFRAVLAHEFGHLSGNHGRFGGWIYHQRQTWMGMLERLHQSDQGWATLFFQLFLNWYAPFFNAYSFVLARTNEYEADRCAAQVSGNRTAAEEYLQQALPQVTAALEVEWRTSVNYQWRQRYMELQEYRTELGKLERKAEATTLTLEEMWTRTRLKRELDGKEETKPLLEEILVADENHVGANLYLGELLLAAEDERGIGYVRKAIAGNVNVVVSGCQLIYGFLQRQGRTKEAEQYLKQAEGHYQELVLAQEERSSIAASDRFLPHGLDEEEARSLREKIATHPDVEVVYFLRKAVKHLPDNPLYVLAVRRRQSFFEADEEAGDETFLNRFLESLTFPGETSIILLKPQNKAVEKALYKSAKEPFYRAVKSPTKAKS